MALTGSRPRHLVEAPQVGAQWDVGRRRRLNLSGRAHERIEDLIVRREPRPVASLTVQDLEVQHLRDPERRLAVQDAVAGRDVSAAIGAADASMYSVDRVFGAMEREIAPALLECSVLPFISS